MKIPATCLRLLIEPFGIETPYQNSFDSVQNYLLIEPFGIETVLFNNVNLVNKFF